MDGLDQIVCGAKDSLPQSSATGIPESLADVSAARWTEQLANAKAELLAVTDAGRPVAEGELEQAALALQADPNLKAILLFPPVFAESVSAWETLPGPLAALRENLAERVGAVVFRVSALKELGFKDVSDPIWDVVIRAAANSGRVQAKELAEGAADFAETELPRLPELAPDPPGSSRRWLLAHLEAFSLEDHAPQVTSAADAVAVKSGLLQIHDHLDASHELSQSVQGRGRHGAGDYWHAIMHRREPDYSNAKYWFRNVGSHPVYEELGQAAETLLSQADAAAAQKARQKLSLGGNWEPFAFVDFCQECCRNGDPALTQIAEQIQWREMQLLLEHTYRDATG